MIELLTEYTDYLNEEKSKGKKIVAFMAHDNIPEELIWAADCIPLKMIFAGNDDLMNESHDHLPPSTCSFAQSCIGLFSLKPSQFKFLDLVDYFIVSNHCVSDICASEIITKYSFIPRLNFYVPYTNKSKSSAEYFKLELLDFKKQLESIKESEIKDEDLLESMKSYNLLREKLTQINEFKIKSSEKLEIFHKAALYGPNFIEQLDQIIEEKKNSNLDSSNTKDVLITSCSIFLGDFLIDLIEDGGGNIVIFDTWIGNSYFSNKFDNTQLISNANPIDLLIQRFKDNDNGDHTIPHYLDNKLEQLLNFIKDYNQKTGKDLCVINHIIKFCDHFSVFQSILKRVLQEQGIKVLNLEKDYSRANRGQLSTRIEAFMEMI